MSSDWNSDIIHMHLHYGMTEKFDMDVDKLRAHLKFRVDFLKEELNELEAATEAEDVVDALIDLVVVAIGTLDAFAVDAQEAWDAVLEANMAKTPGIKPERPNPLGLPDLIKPEGWRAPSHEGNHGLLSRVFETGRVGPPPYWPCEI